MNETTLGTDHEWDALLAKAVRDDARLKKRFREVGSFKFFLKQGLKAVFFLASPVLIIPLLLRVIWIGDAYVVRFNATDWANRHEDKFAQGIRLWNRFEHQHRLVGLRKSEVVQLLGVPDWRNSTTFIYTLGDANNAYKRVRLNFSKDKVASYAVIESQDGFS